MRKILAATLLATVAFTGSPASAGCVEDFLGPSSDDPGGGSIVTRYVTLHPDGSVTVHPNHAVADAGALVAAVPGYVSTGVSKTTALADCVV